jgi:hypothetical protein
MCKRKFIALTLVTSTFFGGVVAFYSIMLIFTYGYVGILAATIGLAIMTLGLAITAKGERNFSNK